MADGAPATGLAAGQPMTNGAGDATLQAVRAEPSPGVPTRRQRPPKEYYVQLSTRVRISLKELLDDYHGETGESIQDTIDQALVGYFESIGWLERRADEVQS